MKEILKSLIILLFSTVTAGHIHAECPDDTTEAPRISLLTAHAGPEIYQLEGHSALRIADRQRGDYVVNWGLFDFAAPNFVYRFVKGETDYMAGATYTELFLDMYRREGRKVVEQVLDLTPEEAAEIIRLTDINLQPANRTYRYNYVLDNCATRPLAIIEKAIGDTLRFNTDRQAAFGSFREAMRSYHRDYPWYQFGIDLALGSGIDRPISFKEQSFAPVALEIMLADAKLPDGRKAVSETTCLVEGKDEGVLLPPTPWYLTPMFCGTATLVIALLLSAGQWRKGRQTAGTRTFDTVHYSLLGLTGCVITFLILISVHEATSPNWLILWANPLCFIAAVTVWAKRAEKLLFCYQIVNFALLIALAAAMAGGAQSSNPAFIPLMAADGVRALTCMLTYIRNRKCQHAKATR